METMYQEALKAGKEWQSFWENRTSQILDEWVKSQNFVQAMTRTLEHSLDARKLFDTNMERVAEFYGFVTKRDLDLVNQQVYDGNARLERLAQTMDEIKTLLREQNDLLAGSPSAAARKKGKPEA